MLVRAAVVCVLGALLVPVGAGHIDRASASYQYVSDGLVQWTWARAHSADHYQIHDVVVRPDGWLIVSTGIRFDGHLYLIPPWGGQLGPHTRIGGELASGECNESRWTEEPNLRRLAISNGRLYGLRHLRQSEYYDPPSRSVARLCEFDIETGELVRELGDFWYQGLSVDPLTGDLILQDTSDEEPFEKDVIRLDPDTGERTVLISDTNPDGDDPYEIVFSPDGQLMFAAHLTAGRIDVYPRDGGVGPTEGNLLQPGVDDRLYSMQLERPIDSIVHGQPGTCFEGMLVFTRWDGSVSGIRPGPNATSTPLAAGGRDAVSSATLGLDGNVLVSRLVDATLVACEPFHPTQRPEPPVEPPPPPPQAPEDVTAAAAAPPPQASSAVPPPPPPPGPAPLAPPALPPAAMPGASVAAQAGLADEPEEEHVLGLSASSRSTEAAGLWARLGLGALAVTGMAGVAFVMCGREEHFETAREGGVRGVSGLRGKR